MAMLPTRGRTSRAARLGDTRQRRESGSEAVTNGLSWCQATWTCVKLAGPTRAASMVDGDAHDKVIISQNNLCWAAVIMQKCNMHMGLRLRRPAYHTRTVALIVL